MENPAGLQQIYPSLLKSPKWIEDVFLFSREVSLDVFLLHCNICSGEEAWLHAGMCYLCWLDPHGMKRHITDQWGQADLWGSTVSSLLYCMRAEDISEVQHLLESRISETNCPQRKTVLLATDHQGSQKSSLGWICHFYRAEVR